MGGDLFIRSFSLFVCALSASLSLEKKLLICLGCSGLRWWLWIGRVSLNGILGYINEY